MTKDSPRKFLEKKTKEINQKMKTSFVLIRKDVDEMQTTIDAMRRYLKNKDEQYKYAKKEDNKIRDEFRKDVDEFTQKIASLNIALSRMKTIQEEVVLIRDLAKIEDEIKTSFKNEIEGYKEQIKLLRDEFKETEKRISAMENGYVREKKKSWFFNKNNK
ncbi:hypothetical protein KAI32_00615 [Candidatus Pacearchaeota archaeon]|nr:hypothetical protein [Candidatus Pacearchaeota archaeon]